MIGEYLGESIAENCILKWVLGYAIIGTGKKKQSVHIGQSEKPPEASPGVFLFRFGNGGLNHRSVTAFFYCLTICR